MKTLTLILSLSLVLTSATVGAQQTAGTEADNQGGFISIEAFNPSLISPKSLYAILII